MGLEGRKLNYLGKLSYKSNNANTVFANALFSSKGKLLQGDLRGEYSHKKVDLGLNFETINQNIENRLSQDLRTVRANFAYNFSDDLHLSAGGRYDLNENQMAKTSFGLGFDLGSWEYKFNQEYIREVPEKFAVSAIYNDECTRLTFSFENRYQDVGSSEPIKSLIFRVQLKPFANVVFSQGGEQITF